MEDGPPADPETLFASFDKTQPRTLVTVHSVSHARQTHTLTHAEFFGSAAAPGVYTSYLALRMGGRVMTRAKELRRGWEASIAQEASVSRRARANAMRGASGRDKAHLKRS